MNLLQTWLLVGVPGLLLVAALFVGHSRMRAYLGYAVLAVLVGVFLTVQGGSISAGVVGLVAVVLVGTAQGAEEADEPEHHETRDRYTHA